ncbi:hypothetical protein E4U55_006878 [Claviceps digitariae]|nr:hypothetical protein E4U55_006878 [Claviceps digitariae]
MLGRRQIMALNDGAASGRDKSSLALWSIPSQIDSQKRAAMRSHLMKALANGECEMDAGRDDRPSRSRKAAMEVESETRKKRELIC